MNGGGNQNNKPMTKQQKYEFYQALMEIQLEMERLFPTGIEKPETDEEIEAYRKLNQKRTDLMNQADDEKYAWDTLFEIQEKATAQVQSELAQQSQ